MKEAGSLGVSVKELKEYVIMAVVSTLFIAVWATSTGFLHPNYYGGDSAIFIYVGKAMKHGYVPYRDLIDTKGPLMWFIQYAGQMLHEGKLGIHILGIINFNVIMFLTYKICRLYLNEKMSLLVSVSSLLI